ncbi:serine/threonine protein kinase [Streptomyces sp. 15-116A]|uniref:serine/threonine-protein kinase n=1 Tax=Streptomyces sp. 15-116A TaxID=2259035 RepID=UPI0021B32215|nr:serine/threonine-protein kinase [Streptomyces sp. 15-116A]MCT7353745.1 serine/threonine protein kinase [Streptomyces sp. 15-116A]
MDALKAQDPARIGVYLLLARLGAGGMGQVYLGRSPGGRLVAIKVIRDEITDHPEALARFRREVETVRAVRSAYTANLIDASLEAPPYWLATEYVSGPTLSKAVGARGPMPPDTCRRLFAALAEGLAAVHAQGVTHRDLKPQNVLLAAQGPQLIDFGIARGVGQTALTEAGSAPGTPGFTAPEVLMRNEVGPPADVFALGATIAYAATGRPPFGVGEPATVSYRAVHEPIDLAGVEPELAGLIELCVAKDPGSRPQLGEVIARCRVAAALVEDSFYAGLVALAEALPAAAQAGSPPVVPPPAAGLHELPTSAPTYGPGYTPTYVNPSQAPARRLRAPWLIAVAATLAAGVVTAAFVLWPDRGSSDRGAGGKETTGAARPGATASASADSAGGDSGAQPPAYVEARELVRDMWSSETQQCNLPAEELNQHVQYSVVPVNGGQSYTSGPLEITLRLKYAGPEPGETYYMSVAVKPPHPVDPVTGEALDNAAGANTELGFVSRPIDMYQVYKTPGSNGTTTLTYPDDFASYVKGEKYQEAFPVAKAPGDWTVLYLHVRDVNDFTSVVCDGFHAQ